MDPAIHGDERPCPPERVDMGVFVFRDESSLA